MTPEPSQHRVAIVTGAASGLGFETARRLLASGYAVTIADLRSDAATEAAAQLDSDGERTLAVHADVADTPSVDAMVAATLERFGRLDVLVNNAGYNVPGPTHEVTDEDWQRMIDVHLTGTLRCSRAAFHSLVEAEAAAIVNISSIAGRVGMPHRAPYTVAKCGIEGLTRVLAVEWAPAGIRVNAVAPGFLLTPLMQKRIDEGTNTIESMTALVPMNRMGRPEEIAAVVDMLASPDASYLTGQVVVVDGGMTIDGRLPGFEAQTNPLT